MKPISPPAVNDTSVLCQSERSACQEETACIDVITGAEGCKVVSVASGGSKETGIGPKC